MTNASIRKGWYKEKQVTERLYYDDAYLWAFDAAVTAVKNGTRPGEWKVTLDRSAF